MANLRLFVAVEISEEVRARAAEVLRALRTIAPEARFVRPEKLHLTLQFLGSVDEARVPDLTSAIDAALKDARGLSLSFARGGSFGNPRAPRVLWIDVGGELEALKAIQEKVQDALAPLGFEPEHHAYSPHLTLARAKRPRGDRELAPCVERLLHESLGACEIRRVVLMQSVNSKAGSEYRVIHEAPLLARATSTGSR